MAALQYSPYSTVQNSFQQFMGNPTTSAVPSALPQPNTSTPIQYPATNLRQGVDNISVSTYGNLSPQDRIARQADKLYERTQAQNMATKRIMGESLTSSLNNLNKLDSFESANANRFLAAGYSPQEAYGNRLNASVDLQRGGPMVGRASPYQQALQRTLNRDNEVYAGVASGTIQDAYRKVLGLV